ncbi:MAG: VCBS repeat-containing protein [Myxococcaceae bacterium]|nr:VCBS repeat-containing protein [Myxococcaceae bacterium]
MKSPLLVLVATAVLSLAAGAQTLPRYNEVQQKHSHNTYQRNESVLEQLLYYSVRSIELDIHSIYYEGTFDPHTAPAGDWAVYHVATDRVSSCKFLSQCLDRLVAFSQAVPQHEVVTVWLELKDANSFDPTHTPDQLDTLLRQKLGTDRLLEPSELLAACPSASGNLARSVLPPCAWPTLASLRGKFVFVLLAQDDAYGDAKYPGQRAAFMQAGTSSFDPSNPPSAGAVFFNGADAAPAEQITAAGYVTRLTTANDADAWGGAVTKRVQFIGTDMINDAQDAWARTRNLLGWPFRCMTTDCTCVDEGASFLHIRALSQDLGGTADSFTFLYEPQTNDEQVWSAFVSVPDSHVEPSAKGCLMARQDTTPGSPYFAVCRPADAQPVRVQYRLEAGGATWLRELSIGAQDSQQSLYLTLISSLRSGTHTCVQGYAALSPSQAPGTLVHEQCFASPLPLQGIGASSNTATPSSQVQPVRFLFGSLKHQVGQNPAQGYQRADFTLAHIGTVHAEAAAGDGMFPAREGFAWQAGQGTRAYGVGYAGKSEWMVDATGDGRPDYVYNRDASRELRVLPATATGFGAERLWATRAYGVGYGGRSEWLADVNGDGRVDYVYNRDGTRELRVLLSTGTGFAAEQGWGSRSYGAGYDGRSEWLADVNGDGRADHVYSRDATRELRVRLSTGAGFGADTRWGERLYAVGYAGGSEWLVDVSGDGRADYVYNRDGTREMRVLSSSGGAFGTDLLWRERTHGVGYTGESQWWADVTGDGRADYLYNRDGTQELWGMKSTGTGFEPDGKWGERKHGIGFAGRSEWFVDVDGDLKADHLYNRDGTREYWAMRSTGSAFEGDLLWGVRAWGVGYSGNSEWLVDVDGDGRVDQLNNRDGGRELWGMTGRTCDAAAFASTP